MALVGFGGEKQLKGDFRRCRRVGQEGVRLVVGFDGGAKVFRLLLCERLIFAVVAGKVETADPFA